MVAGLAQGSRAVMTRGTIVSDPGVVKPCPDSKTYRARMTHLARGHGGEMICRFSGSSCTVVATDAIIRDSGVIELGRDREAYGARVTHLARRDRRNVVCWFSDCHRAVVAGCTGRGGWNVRMVNTADISPCGRKMARLAFLIRRHMVLRLAGYRLAIVAVETKFRRVQDAAGKVAGRASD
jgi:hypothetical protein